MAELNAAISAARPGDVILMREGTWTAVGIRFVGEGTADRPITLRAATAGKAGVTGHSRLQLAGRHLVVDGLRFERCTGPAQFDVVEFRTSSSKTTGHAHGCRLTNCSFVDCSPPDDHAGGTTWEGNILFGSASGLSGQAGVTERDPKLSLAADGLGRPAGDSPAIGAAAGDFPSVTADIDGHARGARKDLGCDQHSTAPIVHRPLTAAEVGPSWRR